MQDLRARLASARTTIARPPVPTTLACARSASITSIRRSRICWRGAMDRVPQLCHKRYALRSFFPQASSMSLKSLDARVLAVFERIIATFCDPARRYRTALIAALVYAGIWTLYAIVAKSSQGINADLGEMVVWARNLAWGYPKHPPLPAWILAGWFAIFPLADWAYYILACLNLGIGLYLSFLLAGQWLNGAKQAAAPFLLALIPFYNFIGLKFDLNSILIPLWALTTWAFVLSYERRDAGYAALAGVAAAAAMLTKYWSVFLLFALCVAALCDRRRGDYFRSAAPYVTAVVGGVLIAPHIIWLVQENYPPLIWVAIRTSETVFVWLRGFLGYLFGTLGYSLVALGTFVVLMRPSLAAWRDIFFPRDERRRMAAIIYWIPILFPIVVAAFSRTNLVSLWNTESLGLLPVVLLSSPLVELSRRAAARIAGFATTVSLASLVASPFVAAGLTPTLRTAGTHGVFGAGLCRIGAPRVMTSCVRWRSSRGRSQ